MERVIETIVVVVVARGCRDSSDHVKLRQRSDLVELALSDEHVHGLGDIATVQVVVVLDAVAVACSNLAQERDEFVRVDDELLLQIFACSRRALGQVHDHLINGHREYVRTLHSFC